MKRVWIIKAGTTFASLLGEHSDFHQWTQAAMGLKDEQVSIYDVDADQTLPEPRSCAGVVITGSHAMVTDDLLWSRRLEEWIPAVVDANVPMLGICYGHQLIARAMGGAVDYHPAGREIGTVRVQLLDSCQQDDLFRDMHGPLPAHAVHAQSVTRLPPGATLLAQNDYEPVHAYRVGPAAWGVQFHPEYNAAIMRCYIEELADELRAASHDVASLLGRVEQTPAARSLLRRFTSLCRL